MPQFHHMTHYTLFNPPKEELLQVNKLIVYHINEDTSSQFKYQSRTVVETQQEKISSINSNAQQTFWIFISI